MSIFRVLLIPKSLHDEMVAQAVAELPNECVGMLAGVVEGDVARVVRRYALTNRRANPREYEVDPREVFAAMKDWRTHGLDELAVYHSHPTSEPVPSKKDLAANYGEHVVSLIISLAGATPEVRAWWLTETSYREAECRVES